MLFIRRHTYWADLEGYTSSVTLDGYNVYGGGGCGGLLAGIGMNNISSVTMGGHITWDSRNYNYETGGIFNGSGGYQTGVWETSVSAGAMTRVGNVGSAFVMNMGVGVTCTFYSYNDIANGIFGMGNGGQNDELSMHDYYKYTM